MSSISLINCNVVKSEKKNILIGCTGSVAALKIPLLVNKLLEIKKVNIKIVTTRHALHFFKKKDVGNVDVLTDDNEWKSWKNRGDPVLHIELTKWADLFVIAPLDANTLGKLANVCNFILITNYLTTLNHITCQHIMLIKKKKTI